jgi:hypothetical protein
MAIMRYGGQGPWLVKTTEPELHTTTGGIVVPGNY